MQAFYKKALAALILHLLADALVAWFCIHQSDLSAPLIPRQRGGVHWSIVTTTDAALGGTSAIRILAPGRQSLRFHFRVTGAATYPFVSTDLLLEDGRGNAAPADLSRYTTVTFVAKCAPANSLQFAMPLFDASVSKPGEYYTYPAPTSYFSCSEQGTPVSLDLTRLTIPPWWFDLYKIDPSRQTYQLDQVAKFMFGTSPSSPRERDSLVEISDLALRGRDDRYLAALAVILVMGWSAFGFWFLRAHSRALIADLESRLRRDLCFVAYRQLTLEPFKDKEKAAILQFIGAHYTDPELDMGAVTARIGVDREKINQVLKTEFGLTFTGYVNQLRLTAAARLLTDKDSKPIADIAHAVGYANIPYFNKLFKEEYGCTPRAFRSLAAQAQAASAHDPPG
jgi:AraC-like DNA-binding protein